jgi:hypothetical protein
MSNAVSADQEQQTSEACQLLEAAVAALDLEGLTAAAALASSALDEALATLAGALG